MFELKVFRNMAESELMGLIKAQDLDIQSMKPVRISLKFIDQNTLSNSVFLAYQGHTLNNSVFLAYHGNFPQKGFMSWFK